MRAPPSSPTEKQSETLTYADHREREAMKLASDTHLNLLLRLQEKMKASGERERSTRP